MDLTGSEEDEESGEEEIDELFTIGLVSSGEGEYSVFPFYRFDWHNLGQIAEILLMIEQQEKILRKALEVQEGLSVYEQTKEEFDKAVTEEGKEKIEERLTEVGSIEELLDLLNLETVG